MLDFTKDFIWLSQSKVLVFKGLVQKSVSLQRKNPRLIDIRGY